MKKGPANPPEPAEADIQKAAYHLWRKNGCPAGRDLDHWLAAKELLCHRHAHTGGRTRPRKASASVTTAAPPVGNN